MNMRKKQCSEYFVSAGYRVFQAQREHKTHQRTANTQSALHLAGMHGQTRTQRAFHWFPATVWGGESRVLRACRCNVAGWNRTAQTALLLLYLLSYVAHREACRKKTRQNRCMVVCGAVQASVCYRKAFLSWSYYFYLGWPGGCGRHFYSIELNITPKSEKWYLGSYTECPKSEIWASSS